jgi:hypothetical protein
MYLDKENLFSNDQAVIADDAAVASTNVVDLGAQSSRVQTLNEKPAKVHIEITEAFNTITSLEFTLQNDGDVAFGSPTTVHTQVVLVADLTLGKCLYFPDLPAGLERYLRMLYTAVGGPNTTGKIVAGLNLDVQTNGM